jgi:peptidoglycan/LPS O-acetylase OafA/YrhL
MFIPGILICEIVQAVGAGWKTKTTGDFFVLLGTAVALAMVCLFSEPRKIELLSADAAFWVILLTLFVALGALTLAAIYSNGPVGRLLSWTPLRWLGNMSYSYYLIHGLTLKALCFALTRAIPPLQPLPIVWWVMFPVSFAVAWIVSTGLFLWVEKRFSLVPSSSRALNAVSPGPAGAFAAIIPTPDCSAAPEPYSRTDRAGQQRLTVSAHPS